MSTSSVVDAFAAVQSLFYSTKCYDLMATSCKVVVFEACIPFQLAFYALVEQDTEVAPLRDTEKCTLVAMMTISDYIDALEVCCANSLPAVELAGKTIAEVMSSSILTFRHTDFSPIEAEDSVFQLVTLLQRRNVDYMPVVDPENNHLIAVLGLVDILHLLDAAAKQYPHFFYHTVDKIGCFTDVVTAPSHAKIVEVLKVMRERSITNIPVTDATGQVIGMYNRSDVTFIIQAQDHESVLTNMREWSVGQALSVQQQQPPAECMGKPSVMIACAPTESIGVVLDRMMQGRCATAVCIGEARQCLGTVSVGDIIKFFFESVAR